ncbi:MAG: protease pro-enzyme activation domain-containing protein, partial [Candidatus Dormibacteria bacterium]
MRDRPRRVRAGWGLMMAAVLALVFGGLTPVLAASSPALSFGRVGGTPAVPRGDVAEGQLPPSQRLTVTVAFKPQDQAALTAFIADLSDRSSPLFRHYLTPKGFGQRFGASLATLHEVSGALSRLGLRLGSVPPDRVSLAATGTVSQIEAAFSVQLRSYRTAGGREAFAPNRAPLVPDPAAVRAVLGLDTLVAYHPLL